MRSNYNTTQKSMIMDVIKEFDSEFTINDVFSKLNDKVGMTTIYRMIDKLIEEGLVVKSVNKSGNTTYQYLEKCNHSNHFYLKCDTCGKLEHVDCDCINELSSHIVKNHKFKVNKENIVISGICNECSR